MSVQQARETFDCAYCTESFEQPHATAGSFCSERCEYRSRGADILGHIRQDHRICATCFKHIKTIEKPSDEWLDGASSKVQAALDGGASVTAHDGVLVLDATDSETKRATAADSIIGYQHPTEHTVWATDAFETDSGAVTLRQRWACECGNVDPSHRETVLEDVDLAAVVSNLYRCLATLSAEGQISTRPDKDRLFDALREEWRDWEYAIGKAVHG